MNPRFIATRFFPVSPLFSGVKQHLPVGSRMPHRSMGDRFVGRVDVLWDLHDLLFEKDVAVVFGVGVIAGTGGLGKT